MPARTCARDAPRHPGVAIGLQLLPHRKLVRLDFVDALPEIVHLPGNSAQVLHVMADLVRDDVGAREITFFAERGIELRRKSRDR